jgi:hypothetical protein
VTQAREIKQREIKQREIKQREIKQRASQKVRWGQKVMVVTEGGDARVMTQVVNESEFELTDNRQSEHFNLRHLNYFWKIWTWDIWTIIVAIRTFVHR